MAQTKGTNDSDVISRLADAGEDAVRRLIDLPRRMVADAVHGIEERLRDVTARVRALDPLEGRVAAMEKRLESLEKPPSTTARRASTRAKPSTARRARSVAAIEPGQAEHGLSRGDDAGAEDATERDEAQARDEGKPAE